MGAVESRLESRPKRSAPKGGLFAVLRVLCLTLLVLFLLAAAAAVFLMSPIGLPVVLSQAKSFVADTGASLETTGESGSLYGGVSFDSLTWTDDATTINATQIKSTWSLTGLLSRKLLISELLVDRLEFQAPPSPSVPSPRQAIVLPPSLALPIEIDVQRVRMRELLVRPAAQTDTIVFKDMGLTFRYGQGAFVVADIELVSPWLSVTRGEVELGDEQPYPVSASFQAGGEVAPIDFETEIRLFGDLDRLRVSLSGMAAGAAVSAQSTLRPLTLAPISAADIKLSNVETARVRPDAPAALLDLSVLLRPDVDRDIDKGSWRLTANLKNIDAGMLNEKRLPLKSVSAVFALADPIAEPLSVVEISEISARLLASQGEATLTGDASVNLSEQLKLAGLSVPVVLASLAVERLDLAPFANPELQTNLSGSVSLSRDRFEVDLRQSRTQVSASGAAGTVITDSLLGRAARIQVRGLLADQALRLDDASIIVGETVLNAKGSVQTVSPFELQANARIESFQPDQWLPKNASIAQRWREGVINARLAASGPLSSGPTQAGPRLQLELILDKSQLAGQPLTANVQTELSLDDQGKIEQIRDLNAKLGFGKNKLSANGSLFKTSADSMIKFTLNLAQMSALDPQIAGRTKLSGVLKGSVDKLALEVKGGARRVRFKPSEGKPGSIGSVTVDALVPLNITAEPDSALRLDVRARDLRMAGERIVTLRTKVVGSPRRHTVDASLNLSGQNTSLTAIGAADLADKLGWRGTIESIRSDGRIRIRSTGQAKLNATAQAVDLSDLALAISGSGIKRSDGRIKRLRVDLGETGRLQVLGQLKALPFAQLISAFRSEPLPATLNNLRLSSEFDLAGSGVDDLTGMLTATLSEQGDRANRLGLAGQHEARFEFDQGAVDGDIDLTLHSLGFTRKFTGPSWIVDGRATLAGTVGGRLTAPTYQVRLSASELSLLQPSLGWRLDRGKLLADISDRGLTLRALRLRTGDEGKIEMTGKARILNSKELPRLPDGSLPTLPLDGRFNLDTDGFVVPIGPGQQLILSGKTRLLAERGRLRWVGNLMADEGLIEIAGSGAPALPDDVQIVTEEPTRKTPKKPVEQDPEQPGQISVETALDINLGKQLRIMGGGVNARLTGKLTLLGNLPADPRAQGLVEIVDGTYQAYSQDLSIRRGEVRFNGPIDNPALNIEAVRPNLPVTAGVSITGLALSPRIDLFSDPSMTDAETLSWLVLGVPIDNAQSGAQSLALKEAASRIIGQDDGSVSGGSFSDKLGLDTLGFGFASDTGQAEGVRDSGAPTGLPGAGGQTSASTYQEVVTLGKKLSDKLSISYEQGVRGLFNLLRVQYEINQRLSLRAQTGSENAVDLLYFWSFD